MAKAHPTDIFYLFTNYDQNDFLDIEWPENVKLVAYKISCTSPIFNILWHQFFFQYHLKKHKCDCCLIPNFSLLTWKVIPTIVVIHDLIEYNVPAKFSKLRVLYRRAIVPLMARKSDGIITISESSKGDIVKFLRVDPQKITVALCSYDAHIFFERKKDEVLLFLDKYALAPKTYLLYVGTVDHPGKNLFTLLSAYIRLKKEKTTDKKLVIIGRPGHNYKFIQQIIENCDYKEDIRILGFVEDHSLPFFYSGASLFCFLSLYEGFGLPVLEAMACGCPVLASSKSSIPEVAGDAAVLVDPTDIDEVAQMIRMIINSIEMQEQLVEKGLNRVAQFDWSMSSRKYYEVLRDSVDSLHQKNVHQTNDLG